MSPHEIAQHCDLIAGERRREADRHRRERRPMESRRPIRPIPEA
jgi:hypothetical protein